MDLRKQLINELKKTNKAILEITKGVITKDEESFKEEDAIVGLVASKIGLTICAAIELLETDIKLNDNPKAEEKCDA